MITATRYHDFSAGHRVAGHENKCAYLHGHNYRAHFTVEGRPDKLGRVLDFGCIKDLAAWLEREWDHQFLVWEGDPWRQHLPLAVSEEGKTSLSGTGIKEVPFNPTAENMADYLLRQVAPGVLGKYPGVTCIRVTVEETRKCSATASL